jgi:hypothetical protein
MSRDRSGDIADLSQGIDDRPRGTLFDRPHQLTSVKQCPFNGQDDIRRDLLTNAQARSVRPRAVTAFLQGLLAEGNLREHLAFEASLWPDDVFGMPSAYGRDTAGALVFPARRRRP